jgi:hypothetical protein
MMAADSRCHPGTVHRERGNSRMANEASTPRPRFRRSKIAFTAFCGIGCVLMTLWWARSFRWWDECSLRLTNSEFVNFTSADGRMVIYFDRARLPQAVEFNIEPVAKHRSPGAARHASERHPWFGFYQSASANFISFRFAHCLLAMMVAGAALVPWCPRRFSVRGLLVTTTAVAFVIGLTIWVDSFY